MVFASPIFLFLFLPIFLAAYYLLPLRFRSAFILFGSSAFYAWWRADFLVLLYGIILWSFFIARAIDKHRDKRLLYIGVVTNLLTLGYFKYFNFGIDSLNTLLREMEMPETGIIGSVLLPTGISFFVFHAVSYIVDVWRKDTPPAKNIFDFAAFITLFPHLIAGPVLRYKDLAHQFANRTHTMEKFSEGAYRFMCGFAKKVLIADTLAPLADAAFAMENPTMADAWLGALAYALQLFFDFAGYSEMAVGLALMMGFRFIENFKDPYISKSITEFWRRWHISLSTWLRDYLYIPLGGNRKGPVRTYINLFLTMLLGGLWHGANWTFILWGAWHGAFLAFERLVGAEKKKRGVVHLVATLLIVLIGWIMFRAPSAGAAFDFYAAMAGTAGLGLSDALAWQVKGIHIVALAAGIATTCLLPLMAAKHEDVELSKGSNAMRVSPSLRRQAFVALIFVVAVSRMVAMDFSPFLYFQF